MKRKRKQRKKPAAKHTEIVCVIDESGSMSPLKKDVIGGINEFVANQAKDKSNTANFTLIKFNTEVKTVFKSVPVGEVKALGDADYVPGGGTALLDAVADAVEVADERTGGKGDCQVVIVVMTDGAENSSRKTSREKLKTLLEDRQKNRGWGLTFLGANIDAFAEGASIGASQGASLAYAASAGGIGGSFAAVASNVRNFRAGGQSVSLCYTEEQRKNAGK